MAAFGLSRSDVTHIELATMDERERAFIRALCSVYPSSMKAYEIMRALGMAVPLSRDWGGVYTRRHDNLIKFHNLRIRVSQLFMSFGWQVERSGGLVTDEYRIAPVGPRRRQQLLS